MDASAKELREVTARIKKATSDGLLLIKFSEPMRVTDELIAFLNNQTNITIDEGEPALVVRVVEGTYSDPVEFTWNITFFNGTVMMIQLDFTTPESISLNKDFERAEITFQDAFIFTSTNGFFLQKDLVLTNELPPQLQRGMESLKEALHIA